MSIGSTISTAVPVKENAANETFTFENISGKNVFVSTMGTFRVCTSLHAKIGWYPRRVHGHMQCTDPGIHQELRQLQGERCQRHLCYSRQRCLRDEVGVVTLPRPNEHPNPLSTELGRTTSHPVVHVSICALIDTRSFSLNTVFIFKVIHFVADDKGAFVGSLGLLFDASPLLGAPRSKVRS